MRMIKTTKRVLMLILMFVAAFSITGCGLCGIVSSSGDMQELFVTACYNCNRELIDELLEEENISQKALNKGLFAALNGTSGNAYDTAVYLIEKGAEADYNKDGLIDYAYNGKNMQMQALLTDKNIDLYQKDGFGRNAMCQAINNRYTSDWIAYEICVILLDAGMEIDPKIFEDDEFLALTIAPKTVNMLINKYLSDGNELDMPETVKNALCGKISEAVKTAEAEKDKLSDNEKAKIIAYAACFGDVKDYEKLKEILNRDDAVLQLDIIAGCGNIQMLEYLVNARGLHLKFDPKTDTEIGERNFKDITLEYMNISSCIECAAAFDEYEMCEYLIEQGIAPCHGAIDYQLLAYALNTDDIELFRLIYDFLKNDIGDLNEATVSGAVLQHSKNNGRIGEFTDTEKEAIRIMMNDGFSFAGLEYKFFNDSKCTYLVENGAEITENSLSWLCYYSNDNAVKCAIEHGFGLELDKESCEEIFNSCDSGLIEKFIQSGTDLPDDVLLYTKKASRKTVKLLIENGANTKLKITEMKKPDEGIVHKGDYTLVDYYRYFDRPDLADIVKEFI